MAKNEELWLWGAFCGVALLLIIGIWILFSWLEARAFHEVTGRDVSTWDAMFIELRVQEGAAE